MRALHRVLLRLYPAGFRQDYGDELAAAFDARAREFDGPFAPLRTAVVAVADVVPNAIAVHLDILRQDIRYGVRAIRRAPGFALTAILVVALGVGANTAAFSLADFVLLRPLAFPEPDRLVRLWQSAPGYGRIELSPPNYLEWKASTTSSFSGMGAYYTGAVNLVGDGEPERLVSAYASAELMSVLGVGARLGRVITREDSLSGAGVVISHAVWQGRFGGDPGVLGRTVRLDGVPYRIVGVMPAGYHFPNRDIDLWLPIIVSATDAADRTNNFFDVIGRLAPGVTVDQARAELAAVAARLEREFPRENEDTGASILPLRDYLSGPARMLVVAVCGAAVCILLLACANLA